MVKLITINRSRRKIFLCLGFEKETIYIANLSNILKHTYYLENFDIKNNEQWSEEVSGKPEN
jgi:hypothetical protein